VRDSQAFYWPGSKIHTEVFVVIHGLVPGIHPMPQWKRTKFSLKVQVDEALPVTHASCSQAVRKCQSDQSVSSHMSAGW